jgi:plastocyanin
MNRIFKPLFRDFRSLLAVLIAISAAQAAGQSSHQISVTNYLFTPKEISIRAGDTVIWTNTQGMHNVNGSQARFPSNPESFGNEVGTDWVFSHVFTIPGTYDYVCDPHEIFSMFGKVIVMDTIPDTLTVHFSGMSPHLGQTMWLSLVDQDNHLEVARISRVVEESFVVVIPGIMSGGSYRLDFFADHNGNGYYDAPPVDHAWRIEIPSASGNESVDFVHNSGFTDVEWKHRLRIRFSGMTPHVGQMLTLYVRDQISGDYLDTIQLDHISEAEFALKSYVIEPGKSYVIDFYADQNGNRVYDAPPADHAWRLETGEIMGDTDLDFVHSTEFTDIFSTTGTVAEVGSIPLKIYPNPATGTLHIRADEGIRSVSLISLSGIVVRQIENGVSASQELSLDGVPSGVYVLEVKTMYHPRQVIRVVKQ